MSDLPQHHTYICVCRKSCHYAGLLLSIGQVHLVNAKSHQIVGLWNPSPIN